MATDFETYAAEVHGVAPTGYPYPESGDPIADGANAIRALAEANVERLVAYKDVPGDAVLMAVGRRALATSVWPLVGIPEGLYVLDYSISFYTPGSGAANLIQLWTMFDGVEGRRASQTFGPRSGSAGYHLMHGRSAPTRLAAGVHELRLDVNVAVQSQRGDITMSLIALDPARVMMPAAEVYEAAQAADQARMQAEEVSNDE